MHRIFKMPFTISISNYTVLFESEKESIYFVKNAKGRKVFSAYNKMKSELKALPRPVDMDYIKYYQTNFQFPNFYADKIYQVDIKSCYSNILLNNKLISQESFEYLSGLEKMDRLAAVGMLAARKNIFTFDDTGNICNHSLIKNIYSDYFFFCVQETFFIMDDTKGILRDKFLFSWVDAIYFIGGLREAVKVQNHLLSKYKLQSTFSELTEFEIELRGDYYRLRYKKDNEPTYMSIPTPNQNEKQELLNSLLHIKYKNPLFHLKNKII